MSNLNGREEKELKSAENMKAKLADLPSVISGFYKSLYNKSYKTRESYVDYVCRFAAYMDKNWKTNSNFYKQVKASDIDNYFSDIEYSERFGRQYKTSGSYKATTWSALNSFFNYLEKNNLVKSNPLLKTERPQVKDNPSVAYLTEDEIHKLLITIKEKASPKYVNRDVALVSLGMSTGLRVSALTQIDIPDIDFANNSVSVIEKRQQRCSILFGDTVKNELIKWIEDREKYFKDVDTDALFVSNYNKRLTPAGVNNILQKYCNGLFDKKITPHVMRHSCATNLYEKTGDIYLCASVLNHKNITTTQRYAEISQTKKRAAADILDKII